MNNKLRSRRGMTMAEMLTTVAIILILAGLAFVTLFAYQRSLAQTERDGIAKEIFIAAQNHLTMARGEGYLGITESADTLGTDEALQAVYGRPGDWTGETGVRYFIVNGKNGEATLNDFTPDNSSLLDLMLPFGSVDETVRVGGSYIIRYQPETGTVLDVFYCSASGSPEKFNHYLTTQEYSSLANMVDTETKDGSGKVTVVSKKNDRRSYTDGSVLGWYGGAEAAKLPTYKFKAPSLDLVNGDTLYAEVTNNETAHATLIKIRLIITGVTSGAKASFKMENDTANAGRLLTDSDETYNWDHVFTLDDITRDGMHFADLASQTSAKFIPGEDIRVEAVVYSNQALGISYSGDETENSLFESIADTSKVDVKNGSPMYANGTKHAYIGSIRHLENLSGTISHNGSAGGSGSDKITVVAASQTKDLYWDDYKTTDNKTITGFKKASKYSDANKGRGTGGTDNVNDGGVVDMGKTDADGYYPVDNNSDLQVYDGLRHSIYYVATALNYDGSTAGLFGNASCKIKNLALIDFNIHGSGRVGALAGTSSGTVLNVIAYNSNDKDNEHADDPETATIVSGGGVAGGLIGSMTGGNMKYCGAALVVKGNTTAGGLIGAVSGSTKKTIEASYSGGHTIKGEYYEHKKNGSGDYTDERKTEKKTVNEKKLDVPIGLYNVTATGNDGIAGGLIGSATKADIKNCYSTCSVEGSAGKSGGFVGVISGSSVAHCYCTGLVDGSWVKNDKNNKWELPANAFFGTCDSDTSSSITDTAGQKNHYYEIINEFEMVDGAGMAYKGSGLTKVTPLDESKADYESFVSGKNTWNPALPYDDALKKYYKEGTGKYLYNLKTVTQLEATAKLQANGTETPKSEIEKSGNPQKPGSLFVNTHYGDWPVPEIFIINAS